MNEKTAKALKYTLSFLAAGVLVWLACRGIDWNSFLQGLLATRWGWIALFVAAAVAAVLLRAARWKQMLRTLDGKVDFRRTWDAANVGNLVNILFPGAGELVRCGIVAHHGPSFERVLGTVVMERFWDFLAVGVLLLLALVLGRDIYGDFFREQIWLPLAGRRTLLLVLAGLLVLVCLACVLVFRLRGRIPALDRLARRLSGFWQGLVSFREMPGKGIFLVYTVLIWTMYVLMSLFVLRAIPDLSRLGGTDALLLSAVGNLASVIPVPGGIGAYHYLLRLTVVSLYGATEEAGLLFATLCHELHAIVIVVLGAVSWFTRSAASDPGATS